MKHQSPSHLTGLADAGAELARLRHVQTVVREIAGLPTGRFRGAMDESARVSAAYASALPIVQRRFEEEAALVARWSRVGLEALLTLDESGRPVEAAARRLAEELEGALAHLALVVGA